MLPLVILLSCAPQGETFGLSRADEPSNRLVFNNGTEPEYLDPGQATGHPDGVVIGELFDGLTEYHPADLTPLPGVAHRWETHPDGRGYTFFLREEARWSDGTPVTAHDFVWSWERVLNPIYLARFATQLYAVENARRYNQGRAHLLQEDAGDLRAGAWVEAVESHVVLLTADAPVRVEPEGAPFTSLPAGIAVARGVAEGDWLRIRWREGCPDLSDQALLLDCTGPVRDGWIPAASAEPYWPLVSERVVTRSLVLLDDEGEALGPIGRGAVVTLLEVDAERGRVYAPSLEAWGTVPLDALAHPRGDMVRFGVRQLEPIDWTAATEGEPTEGAQLVERPAEPDAPSLQAAPIPVDPPVVQVAATALFPSPDLLGFRAPDDHTLVVRLGGTAPYFLQQTSHTTLRAVPRWAIEAHGPRWTRPENIVTSGPFRLVEHEVRDKIVLHKNEAWWGAEDVALDEVVLYAVEDLTTSANLYRAGYTDLVTANNMPPEFIPMLEGKEDFRTSPALSTYYYRLNTDRPPLDDPRVRRALSMAIDRDDIVTIKKGGELPATSIVPPGLPGYEQAPGPGFDPDGARRLLAEAGYPDGKGFPEVTILYNTLESHKHIAAVVQAQWRKHLGIQVQLANREWKTYLKSVTAQDYDVARAGWIGDYLDPNTFLELWVTDGGNNNTGWSSAEYDALIEAAAGEPDPAKRLAHLHEAEAMLAEEMPFIPLYWYVWAELVQPDVHGYEPNLMDQHPLRFVRIER